jgi:hypothetical protein
MDTPRRLCLVCGLPLPLFAFLIGFSSAGVVRATTLPADTPPFPAILYGGTPARGGLGGYVAQFTPQGPIAGTIQPAKVNFEHVVVDPRGPTYYGGFGWHSGVGPARFDPVTGATVPLAIPDQEIVSWPTGLTFDTTRNRLLLSNLGGVGLLYAYSPETDRWTRLTDLANVDMWSMTYSAADDALYALAGTKLLRYTPDGRSAGAVSLSPTLPSGLDDRHSQLIATGDKLALLTQPVADPLDPRLPAVQRSYLIDPHTGTVTSLGPIQVVPEPCAVASLGAVLAIQLRRRVARR